MGDLKYQQRKFTLYHVTAFWHQHDSPRPQVEGIFIPFARNSFENHHLTAADKKTWWGSLTPSLPLCLFSSLWLAVVLFLGFKGPFRDPRSEDGKYTVFASVPKKVDYSKHKILR